MKIKEYLPKNINELLYKNRGENNDLNEFIKSDGYIPPEIDILIDAISALSMGKNILLKGPTGAGKTKLAETLSHLFTQPRSEEHTSELQSRGHLVCRLLLEKKKDT